MGTELQIAALVIAPLFGIGYNTLVAWLESRQVDGETALLVAGGVAVTVLLATPFIGWQAAAWLLLFFALTGTPMIIGSKMRYHAQMRRAQMLLLNGLHDGDEAQD